MKDNPAFTTEQNKRCDELLNATKEYLKVLTEKEDLEIPERYLENVITLMGWELYTLGYEVRWPTIYRQYRGMDEPLCTVDEYGWIDDMCQILDSIRESHTDLCGDIVEEYT